MTAYKLGLHVYGILQSFNYLNRTYSSSQIFKDPLPGNTRFMY